MQGDVLALPWEGNHFTCAAGVEMLYFVEDPAQALAELYRVLKPGGRFVSVVAAPPESPLSKLIAAPWLKYLCFYSSDELATMLRTVGFGTVQVQRVDPSERTSSAYQLAYAVK